MQKIFGSNKYFLYLCSVIQMRKQNEGQGKRKRMITTRILNLSQTIKTLNQLWQVK